MVLRTLGLALFLVATISLPCRAEDWFQLAPLPDPLGVAGPFAGVTGDGLLVAGGANFPEKPPWEGGKKIWSQTVWWLEKPEGPWQKVGEVPSPRGYGVSVSHGNSVICVGGSDKAGHHADCFRLRVQKGKWTMEKLPPLPSPLANACGSLLGDVLYCIGGQAAPDSPPSRQLLALDLTQPEKGWRVEAPLPGRGRILAAAGADTTNLVVAGGVDLIGAGTGAPKREYLKDVWAYSAAKGWSRLADLPKPLAASPSAMPFRLGRLLLLGGDDGTQIGMAPQAHRGFDRGVLLYNPHLNVWEKAGEIPVAHVTVPAVSWKDLVVVPSGEVRPGVRSPRIWAMKTQASEPKRK